ncbi:PAS domain-containing sensor histidine kinase [Virgisporangium ochraceum]|uniref:histidine kinase n=1 Tax=Virgisporangium ochraceum TaxID=65505 RepID=A0A8J4A6B5_9ACTN|nr:PAS domain-containing sensor histidine kinase [Virgisporangium ochraceum]GIJ75337.1 histidine kinase [Virgisporangium ochraceum]
MADQVFLLANVVIMIAYAAIMVAIVVPVARAGQLRTNKLAVATALIFFSCSVGHGLHAVMAYRSILQPPGLGHDHVVADGWPWTAAVWDVFTALVGAYYWTLRRAYGVLLGKGAIFVDPWQHRRLAEADARERAALEDAESRRAMLAAVVEHTDDAIIGLTPEGRVTAWNPGAQRLFGYTAEEVIGQPATIFADDADRHRQDDTLTRIRHGERGISYEARRLHRDGHPIDVSFTVAPIHDGVGTVIGVSVVARDITAAKEAAERQRQLQERTNQAQRMESLGNLAGGVAHDFNNILAIIANYTDFAIAASTGDPEVQADLTQVRTATERATNLTRQLLTFTRADTIRPQDVDLNIAVAEVKGMLERTIGEHITLITRPARHPLTVRVDPGQLQQVLLNLAINARDAMAEGGTLVIEANSATVDGDELDVQPPLSAGAYARLLVSDTGVGIPPEVAEHIFEPFYTTKPRGKGTGLGLATVYGIVSEAGGGINLYSEPGIGTTFRIYLPLVTGSTAQAVQARPRRQPPRGAGQTILVVEDEPALTRVVTRILSDAGYHVIAANNGPEALDLFERHGCDALLTDVIMPEMSGRRLAELVHQANPDLPVLYMSGYSNGLLGTTQILDDDIAFIEKPFTADELLHKLHATLAGRTATANQ